MQLSLSSTAAPSASLPALRRGARRRALDGLELVVDPGEYGPGAGRPDAPWPPSSLEGGTPPVRWILLEATRSPADLLYWSRQAHLLDAGLVCRGAVTESPLCVPLALAHSTDRASAHRAATWARMHEAQTCWEVEIGQVTEQAMVDVLDVTTPTLAHVRLVGAGPEDSSNAERVGTGDVLRVLALRGYSGTVALAPSAGASRARWRRWLFDERGWGCNTAAKKKAAR